MLDTLKPSQEITDHPETKHENTPRLAALAGHHLDKMFKASAYAWKNLSDPLMSKSGDPTVAPVLRAYWTKETYWEINACIQALQPADAILGTYDWKDLSPNSVVIDDLSVVIEDADKMWKDLLNAQVMLE
ncbi:hypothetical protein DXG03_006829, partial [Asterophora parasitica]